LTLTSKLNLGNLAPTPPARFQTMGERKVTK
jgi:hypothetical protein